MHKSGSTNVAGRRRRIVLLCLVVLLTPLAWAQREHVRFKVLSPDEGLSQTTVLAVLQDSRGLMWFGTQDGLNTFDGYSFKVYSNNPEDPSSITSGQVRDLMEDRSGFIWVCTWGYGLDRFDREKGVFEHYRHDGDDPDSLSMDVVQVIFEDEQDGKIWIGTQGGGLDLLDVATGKFKHHRFDPDDEGSLSHNHVWAVLVDRAGGLWVGTHSGLNHMAKGADRFTRYLHREDDPDGLPLDHVSALFEDSRGRLWVGTLGGGLSLMDRGTGRFTHYQHQRDDSSSLSDNEIFALVEDEKAGRLWVGTGGGLGLFDPDSGKTLTYKHQVGIRDSLGHNLVRDLHRDRSGTIWVGTYGNGVSMYSGAHSGIRHYKSEPNESNTLSTNDVRCFYRSKDNNLWVGTATGGLNFFEAETGRATHYRHDLADSKSLAHDRVLTLLEDSKGRFWVGSYAGVDLMDRKNGTFQYQHQLFDNTPNPKMRQVRHISEDRDGAIIVTSQGGGIAFLDSDGSVRTYDHDPLNNDSLGDAIVFSTFVDPVDVGRKLWFSTAGGMDCFDPETERFTHYRSDPNDPTSLSYNYVMHIYGHPDRFQEELWVATLGGGLNRFDRRSETFRAYHVADGLPNNTVYGIQSDNHGSLWLSTNAGLSRFNPETEDFRNFQISDGLQSLEFNGGAFYTDPKGELFFGGINGFNAFFPDDLPPANPPPQVMITDLLILNKPVQPQLNNPKAVLQRPISETKQLTLSYLDYVFSFEFAGLDHANADTTRYAYRMDGLDDDWIITDAKRRFAVYNRLDSGQYTFRLKAGTPRDWSEQETQIKVDIESHPLSSKWAMAIYGLIALGLLQLYRRKQHQKLEKERLLSQERLKAQREHMIVQRLRQIDKLKDEFLANTSHELRTPLNGIIGLAESLIDGVAGDLPKVANYNLAMIAASGKRLSSLVNDILDFAKLRNKSLELSRKPIDLISLTDVVLTLLRSLTEKRNLVLVNEIPVDVGYVMADEDRLQQILHNLIGNAIKFTEQGRITISAEQRGSEECVVHVSDTGIGMLPEKLETIFESFEQLDGTSARSFGGTGLGLAITRQLVTLHEGEVWARSSPGKGSIFSFTLPTTKEEPDPMDASPSVSALNLARIGEPEMAFDTEPDRFDIQTKVTSSEADFNILIVDDERVNRRVLANHLSPHSYNLTEASSGKEALDLLEQGHRFDLILLDVMMPVMSGYEVCEKIRKRYPVYDLPIIFLTAKNQISDLVTGFAAGANDYLSKPVSKNELLSRVSTHLQLLDTHRNLESKVEARTRDLEDVNREVLKTQRQLLLQEKLASLGTLTAGIAHEIKNPLNFVNNFSELIIDLANELREKVDEVKEQLQEEAHDSFRDIIKDLNQSAASINKHGTRANNIIQSMMSLASGERCEWRNTDLNNLVDEFIGLAYHGFRTKEKQVPICLEKSLDKAIGLVPMAGQNLSRVIINLMNNAFDAVTIRYRDEEVGYEPKVRVETVDAGNRVRVIVSDNGKGIPQSLLDEVFNPFFTTKPSGYGNIGLGLYISYDIVVNEHGGDLMVETEAGSFTRFIIEIPKHREAAQVLEG